MKKSIKRSLRKFFSRSKSKKSRVGPTTSYVHRKSLKEDPWEDFNFVNHEGLRDLSHRYASGGRYKLRKLKSLKKKTRKVSKTKSKKSKKH